MNKIVLYGMQGCPYCDELKNILTKNNLNFDYIDVDLPENDGEFTKLFKITNSDQVPMVKIGKQILVPNVSFKSINECYDIICNLINEK